MTEDQPQETAEPIRTASDLRLDDLAKRLDALEKENRELRDANKELYAYAARSNEASITEGTVPDASASHASATFVADRRPSFSQVQTEAAVPQGPTAQDLDNMENMVLANWHLERDRKM